MYQNSYIVFPFNILTVFVLTPDVGVLIYRSRTISSIYLNLSHIAILNNGFSTRHWKGATEVTQKRSGLDEPVVKSKAMT